MSEAKPQGSGYFAAACGAVFFFAFAGSFFVSVDRLSPEWIVRIWFLFVAGVLLSWGINRVRNGRQDRTIGQKTINLVITLIGASVALLGFLQKR